MSCDACESRIYDGGDPLYGYRSFRDVGRENQFSPVGWTDGLVLLRRREFAVQWQHAQRRLLRDALARRLRSTYRSRARQEDEHVAVQAFGDETAHGRLDLKLKRTFVVTRRVF